MIHVRHKIYSEIILRERKENTNKGNQNQKEKETEQINSIIYTNETQKR